MLDKDFQLFGVKQGGQGGEGGQGRQGRNCSRFISQINLDTILDCLNLKSKI